MRTSRLGALLAATTFTLLYQRIVRPWYMTWGTTLAEQDRFWPGDELTPDASDNSVRAITIDAPVSQVWPWIMQIGQDRAGFYSYAFLENIVGAHMKNIEQLIPGIEPRFVGDVIWLASPGRYASRPAVYVVQIEPDHFMVTVGQADWEHLSRGESISGSWSWILDPISAERTRLIMRSRRYGQSIHDRLINLIYDPAHFIMEQRMMRSLKKLAEGEASRST